MRNLQIKCNSTQIERGQETFRINEVPLEKLIAKNLPKELEHYEPYIADIDISIKIYTSDIKISADYEREQDEVDESRDEINLLGGNEIDSANRKNECL